MGHDIQTALEQLQGLPLSDLKYAGNMPMFSFGVLTTVPHGKSGKAKKIGEFSLHIQSPWRLIVESKVFTGSEDYDLWAVDLANDTEEPAETQRNEDRLALFRAAQLFKLFTQEDLTVVDVKLYPAKGFALQFMCNLELEVVPAVSFADELWRLFKPGIQPHFVCKQDLAFPGP